MTEIKDSPPTPIEPGKNFVYPIEVQEAKDPNLCHWSEYYFLSLLADTYLRGEKLPTMTVSATFEGQEVTSRAVQKRFLQDVPFGESTVPLVKLGQPTALIMEGPLEDFILIPSQKGTFSIGRMFGEGADRIDHLHNSIWGEVKQNQPLHAAYVRIQEAKSKARKSNPSLQTYFDLFTFLKQQLVPTIQTQKEGA